MPHNVISVCDDITCVRARGEFMIMRGVVYRLVCFIPITKIKSIVDYAVFFDGNRLVFVNNQKLCSKSTFSQHHRLEENAHTDRIFMCHSDVNERVYPYVHDGNARFSGIAGSDGTICKYRMQYLCVCEKPTACRRNRKFQITVL